MSITVKITLDGTTPLCGAWVELAASNRRYRTDAQGNVTIDVNHRGLIKVLSENPVVRMIVPLPQPLVQLRRRSTSFWVEDGETVEIESDEREPFALMQMFKDIYDHGLRDFSTWDGEHPLIPNWNLDDDWDSDSKIEVMYPTPENIGPLRITAWTQPVGAFSEFPIIHLKSMNRNTAAHELGHALHFGKLPVERRRDIQRTYLQWLLSPNNRHHFSTQTTSFVAFIEAFGWFAWYYALKSDNSLSGIERHKDFWNQNSIDGYDERGDDVEGAVYAALFGAYAQTPGIGLDFVVRTYVESMATMFAEYAEYVRRTNGLFSHQYSALRKAADAWGMPMLRSPCVRAVVSRCLHKGPPLSLKQDIFNGAPAAGQSVSLKSRLNAIDKNCP